MALRFPDTVARLRASGDDEYGNPAASWDTPDSLDLKGFQASPTVLILPPGSDVRAGDRVTVNGVLFAVAGEPVVARSLLTAKAVVVSLGGITDA